MFMVISHQKLVLEGEFSELRPLRRFRKFTIRVAKCAMRQMCLRLTEIYDRLWRH